jgi:hypothetical protein
VAENAANAIRFHAQEFENARDAIRMSAFPGQAQPQIDNALPDRKNAVQLQGYSVADRRTRRRLE